MRECFNSSDQIYSLDTYMSHEGVLYCKPHHRELFQPKVVVREHDEPANTRTQEAIGERQLEQRKDRFINSLKVASLWLFLWGSCHSNQPSVPPFCFLLNHFYLRIAVEVYQFKVFPSYK